MNARELVAWNVRRIRGRRGISSETLAAESGVDRAYVSRIERAVANPTIGILEQIAAVLEVGIDELFAVPEPDEERPMPLPAVAIVADETILMWLCCLSTWPGLTSGCAGPSVSSRG
jgi:transcriptional regulator with XRE-family HTH domain